MEMRVMHRQGRSVRAIAKELGSAHNTVRRHLREESARRFGPPDRRRCKLDAFHDYLRERVARARPRWIPATVLLREIAQRGYTGGIIQLKVFLALLKVV